MQALPTVLTNVVQQSRRCLHTKVGLYADVPVIVLFGPVHFRIVLAFLDIHRWSRGNQGDIDDAAFAHQEASLSQVSVVCVQGLARVPIVLSKCRNFNKVVASGADSRPRWMSAKAQKA